MARTHRNNVNKAIRNAKSMYIKDELTRNRSDPKKFWRSIHNNILPNKSANVLNLLDPQSNMPLDSSEIPYKINEYFSEIGPKLAGILPAVDLAYFDVGNENEHGRPGDTFEVELTNIDIVINHNKEISVYKSSGISDLGSRLLKDVFLYIPDILLDIFNKVIISRTFPDDWKIATVIPLPKVNNPKTPSELRPISLLPIIGKIMEKIIHNQLKKYLEENNMLTAQQHGFRKNHSTQSACAKFIDDIMLHLDGGDRTVAVFLDIKKAFDTLNHNILLKKIEKLLVGPNTVALLRDYLDNRQQCVLYNNVVSSKLSLSTGVPQGSTLGPLLFLIYINDLPDVLLYSDCILFADDTVLYLGESEQGILYPEIQLDLDAVNAWCNNNQITLNQAKTEYIQFSYRKTQYVPEIPLKLGNKNISKTDSYKYLGTVIDSKLNCQSQYNNLIKKLSVKKTSFSKTDSAIALYKACIQPLFDYNDFYYMLLSQKLRGKLQSMQHRLLRIVFKGSDYDSKCMLDKVGVEKLELRRQIHMAGLMYKRAQFPEYLDNRQLPTRQFDKKVLKIPDVDLTKTFKSPIYLGSTLWNALPIEIQSSDSYKKFKYQCKQYLR